jgi:prepilin-type N-terminal cleavage/methylation domain-containing protein
MTGRRRRAAKSGPNLPGRTRRGGGFTLIELLVAAALLAVLAVLSWRGLDAVLDSRRRIVAASDELRSLSMAFAQLDEDLRRSWPVRLLRLQVPSIGFTVSGERAAATLELLREATGASEPTQLQRVAWRLRGDVLERGFGLSLAPALLGTDGTAVGTGGGAGGAGTGGSDASAERGPGALVWQPVLAGVAQVQMQGWIAGQGWIAAESLAGQLRGPGAAAPAAAAAVQQPAVTGLTVRVVRTDGSVVQRILPVKD